MKDKQTKTQENLMTAFLRESGAFNEYTFYAEQAKKDGYEQIYRIFTQFASNEQAHAKVWFKLFHTIAGTEENLKDSADLENFERTVLYSEFAKTAREEGFEDIAKLFDGVAAIERQHEEKYKELLEQVKNKKVFESQQETWWQCSNCGHRHKGFTPPEKCPVCSHPIAFFSVMPGQN
ncbi:MAG: rubrerythrin family protein [Clostridia bacterium]|nr:rubrerythrin family protein [Clostridia bacterium]